MLTLKPCYTREDFIRDAPKYYATGYTGLTPSTIATLVERDLKNVPFDNLNCMMRIDNRAVPREYWRCYEPCVGPTTVYPKMGRSWLEKFGKFTWQKILPILIKMIPVFGTVITDALAPLVAEAIKTLTEHLAITLAEEIEQLIEALNEAIKSIFEFLADPEIQKSVRDTFSSIGVSAKVLTDALKSAVVHAGVTDPRTLLAYVGVRDGLGFAGKIIGMDTPSLGMLKHMSVTSCLRMSNYATAHIWRDMKKSLVSVQDSSTWAVDLVGGLNQQKIQDFVAMQLPDPNVFIRSDNTMEMTGYPLDISNIMVEKYSGKPKDMMNAYDPRKIADLIPRESDRAAYLSEVQIAMGYDRAIAPFVEQADQDLLAALNRLGVELQAERVKYKADPKSEDIKYEDMRWPTFTVTPELSRKRDAWRTRLINAYAQADATIYNASRDYLRSVGLMRTTPLWPVETGPVLT